MIQTICRRIEKKTPPSLLLAKPFNFSNPKRPNINGYWYSEKLDGIRVFWNGQGQLVSRLGNTFDAPSWFTNSLPSNITLDGELYLNRNKFSETVSCVSTRNSQRWNEITFFVFDIPTFEELPFEKRIEKLSALFPKAPNHPIKPSQGSRVALVKHEICKDENHLSFLLDYYENLGAEGIMLRQPGSLYIGKRSSSLLKVKSFHDAEAIVIGYEAGKGKYLNMVGALICKMESGNQFSVGSGLSDYQRQFPPPVGSIINYRYQEITKDGVPRFPSFRGVAIDKDHAKD